MTLQQPNYMGILQKVRRKGIRRRKFKRVGLAFLIIIGVVGVASLAWGKDGTTKGKSTIPTTILGQVVGVADGDTIIILKDKKPTKIRLHGIDCPEKYQAFGTKAKRFTSDLVFKEKVTVEVLDLDRYGRTVGIVTLKDGTNLNHELVKAGLAWWYRYFAPKDATLKKLEEEARSAKRGLWADKSPIPPWEFRRKKKAQLRIRQ